MDKNKNVEEMTEGQSCAVDGSCCGADTGVAAEQSAAASCTLDPSAMPERVARWRALFGQVTAQDTGSTVATFCFPKTAETVSELEELVKLERVCCAHVAWAFGERGAELVLTLEADAASLRAVVAGFMPEVTQAREEGA